MRRALIPVAFVVLAFAAACSGGGSSSKSSGSSSGATTTTTKATTTTAKATTTSTTASTTTSTTSTTSSTTTTTEPDTTPTEPPLTELSGPATPDAAAQGLYNRWTAGDQAGAAAYARESAIAPLFNKPGADAAWEFQGCEGVAGGASCAFRFEGGSAHMHAVDLSLVGDGTVTGFKVDEISLIAD